MFGYDGSVRIKADLNHSDFDRGIAHMTKSVNNFGGTLKKVAGIIGTVFGVATLVNFGKEAVKLASDIQEVQNVIDVTFGSGAAKIEEFAQSAAEAFGLSELSAKQYAGTMGAMLKSSGLATSAAQDMSIALSGLAGDLASFYNLNTDEAFEKIRSGISGETEPLKQLGINMSVANLEAYALSKGITKSYNAMSQAEQVVLRYNYLLSTTADAQGDFARTSGSFANQIRILQLNFDQLKIAVGNAIIPVAQAVLPGINAMIEGLTRLAQVFAQVTALLFGKSAEIKTNNSIASSATSAADAADDLADATTGVGGAAKKAEKDMKGVLAGFDELNILADNAADSLNSAAGGLDIGGLDVSAGEIWGDAKLNPDLRAEVYALTEKLKEMIPLIAGIGAGLLSWKIANALIPDLGLLEGVLGSLMVTAGVTLLVDSIKDIIFGDGLTWENILKGAAGGALAGAGLGWMLAKKLGLTWAEGMLGGAVIGLGVALLLESIADIITEGLNIGNGILGMIGGAIAGAAAGFLKLKTGEGAILGATIGVGISLVIEAITDILANGKDWGNSILGLIGGALAGASSGVKFIAGGGLKGGILGAIIGVGLTLAIEGIASQISSGVNFFDGIMTVLGTAMAGAGIGFAIGNVPGAIAGVVIGFAAGIVLEIIGIQATGKAIYEATEDFQTMTRMIDECEDAANRSSAAMETLSGNISNLTTSLADVGAAQSLADEIYTINDNANASAYELELMATKVELLNGLGLDGLQLTIDETTGRIIETKEATDQLIAALQKEAETAALQELLVQAYKDRYTAVADAESAVKSVTAAEQALAKTEDELTSTPWWDLQKHAALTEQQKKQTEALEAAMDARDKAVTAYDELSEAIDTYSGALTNLSEPESSVGVQLEERMKTVRETVEDVAKDMPEYGKNIGEGIEKGISEGIKEEETKKSFWQIAKDFISLFKIHSPSKVFEEYGGFLMKGLYNGMDDNTDPVTKLFSELWDDIQKGAEGTWGDVQNAWKNAGSWFEQNVKRPVNTAFDGVAQSAKSAFNSAIGTVEGMVNAVIRAVNWLISQLNRIHFDVPDWVPGVGGKSFGINIPTVSTVNLPRLANGAVIPPNHQFAAILGDQRSGTNIEAPAALIKEMLSQALLETQGMRGDVTIEIPVNLDGKTIARIVVPHINNMSVQAGKPVILF